MFCVNTHYSVQLVVCRPSFLAHASLCVLCYLHLARKGEKCGSNTFDSDFTSKNWEENCTFKLLSTLAVANMLKYIWHLQHCVYTYPICMLGTMCVVLAVPSSIG